MTCDAFRELISAELDGELGRGDERRLDAHLAGCAPCRAHADQASALQRTLRLHAATELADLTPPAPALRERIARVTAMQLVLGVIGTTLVALNAGDLFVTGGADLHLTRHDAVFGTALGVGMLSVTWRPHRAMGLVPLTSVIAVLMALVAIADLAGNRANLLTEAVHVLEFLGLVALWIISGGVTRLQRRWSMLPSLAGRAVGS